MSMRSRVTNRKGTTRKVIALVATTLLSLLLSVVLVPACSAASVCTMPCCAHSEDLAGQSVMPAAACSGSSDCSMRALHTGWTAAVLAADPASADDAAIPSYTFLPNHANRARALRYAQRPTHPASARLYIINDVFLI